MTNTMTYKGYAARIEHEDNDGIFTGKIAGSMAGPVGTRGRRPTAGV
ncbi:hypothetical protein [Histidinibacterium lentulum]|nr:hypothetical protein [Histidinibacterium lentulum]